MRRLVLVLALASPLAGCGSSGLSATDRAAIGTAVTASFQALGAGDGAAVCALMTPSAQAKTAGDAAAAHAGNTCAAGIALVHRRITARGAALLAATTVAAITPRSANHAVATLRTAGQSGYAYVRKIGGRWLLANGASD